MGRTAGSYAEAELQHAPARRDPVDRGPRARRLQGDDQLQLRGRARSSTGPSGTGLATRGESHGLSIAPNGWVIYIGRGDCRTDAERGALARPARRWAAILDHANPNVGVGCGNVHIFDPAAVRRHREQRRHARRDARRLRRRRPGGERTTRSTARSSRACSGVTAAPDFAADRAHLRAVLPDLQPEQPEPAGPRRRRRASRRCPRPRISRFTIDLETKQLDLDLRGRDLRVRRPDLQLLPRRRRHGLRLRGQPLRHHRRHELLAGHRAATPGNNPTAKCPQRNRCPAPATRPQAPHCGERNFSYQDARRTAGNTNDYNGKMLRFNPIDDDPGRRAAGGRHRHAPTRCPTRRLAERPEPVRRHRGRRRPGQARDLRDGPAQPVTALDRPGDRRALHGLGRPGRRRAERDAGPLDVRERRADRAAPATTAGPTAWATSRATATALADGALRTTNEAGVRLRRSRGRRRSRAGTTATTSSTTRRTTPA